MEVLSAAYRELISRADSSSKAVTHITPENVYQVGQPNIRLLMDEMLADLALPGSGIDGAEHLCALFEKAQDGATCLVLPEHYSNTDLPCISWFLRGHSPQGAALADSLVAIAGMKLNEQNPHVAAFASAYSRLVICPSRYLDAINGEKDPEERLRVIQINRASMRVLNEIKRQRKVILVFPAGTRYRPGDEDSRRGVREIDSYIKGFDYMCLLSINGLFLKVRDGDMIDDYVERDLVRLTSSPVISCAEFRDRAKSAAGAVEDKKQAVVDAVMAELKVMHDRVEPDRQRLLAAQGHGS